jgi:hypothetical protein
LKAKIEKLRIKSKYRQEVIKDLEEKNRKLCNAMSAHLFKKATEYKEKTITTLARGESHNAAGGSSTHRNTKVRLAQLMTSDDAVTNNIREKLVEDDANKKILETE